VIKASGGSVKNRRIAILGLAFKPNTDDIRNSPSIAIIQVLLQAGIAYVSVGRGKFKLRVGIDGRV
jgi:UDPglucose 6-dehydrogenase